METEGMYEELSTFQFPISNFKNSKIQIALHQKFAVGCGHKWHSKSETDSDNLEVVYEDKNSRTVNLLNDRSLCSSIKFEAKTSGEDEVWETSKKTNAKRVRLPTF